MKNDINLQDAFLNVVRQQGQVITVILMNGYQMRGVIRGFDSFIVMLESDGRQQMIYKHAISTMIPTQRVEFYTRREERMAGE
ncbi:MAG: RNA chaperone Hfq [Butyricicoccus pullicaecorum]|nr:RNA chaperone Hfq [Butyricicoccus pullicaecorum]